MAAGSNLRRVLAWMPWARIGCAMRWRPATPSVFNVAWIRGLPQVLRLCAWAAVMSVVSRSLALARAQRGSFRPRGEAGLRHLQAAAHQSHREAGDVPGNGLIPQGCSLRKNAPASSKTWRSCFESCALATKLCGFTGGGLVGLHRGAGRTGRISCPTPCGWC
jgi:hypothetical protein